MGKARQNGLTRDQRERIGVGTSSMRVAMLCNYCGCVHSTARDDQAVIHGWLNNFTLGKGWKVNGKR